MGEERREGGGEGNRGWERSSQISGGPPLTLGCNNFNLQSECLVPLGVEGALDCFGLLFALTFGVRNEFQFHVGI